MGVVLSGQAVPIVSKGVFLYSGTTLASEAPTAKSSIVELTDYYNWRWFQRSSWLHWQRTVTDVFLLD